MKHIVWGILAVVIGVFLLLAALFLAKVSVWTNFIYGGLFVVYGIYRLNQYQEERKQNTTSK